MCAAIPYAFELKVGSVVLSGLDLPELLPPSAALPPHYEVLPGLVDGVEDARLAVQEAAAAAGPASQLSKETDTAAPTGAVAQDMEVQGGLGEVARFEELPAGCHVHLRPKQP